MKRWLFVLAACGGSSDDPAPPPPPKDASIDAPPVEPPPVGSAGMHVDDDAPTKPPANVAKHPGHPIDITLRCTPSPARVLVDGMLVGKTPALWSGTADGMPHRFTFIYEPPPNKPTQRYAVGQYTFIPVASGIVHAKLEPIASDLEPASPPPP